MPKVILSMGHGGIDNGSTGYDGLNEKKRIREITPIINDILNKNGVSTQVLNEKDSNGKWAFKSVQGDLKVSLHFNAYNSKATGIEILYKKDSMRKHANQLSSNLSKIMNITNRGEKYRSDLYMMNIGFDLLIEICFHDNKSNLDKYNKKIYQVAETIANYIMLILDIKQEEKYKVNKQRFNINDKIYHLNCIQANNKYYLDVKELEQCGFEIDYDKKLKMPIIDTMPQKLYFEDGDTGDYTYTKGIEINETTGGITYVKVKDIISMLGRLIVKTDKGKFLIK